MATLIVVAFMFGADVPPAPAAEVKTVRFEPTAAQRTAPRIKEARVRRDKQIERLFAAAGLDYPPAQVLMRLFKRDGALELWARPSGSAAFVLVKSYAVCASSGDLGPKRRQGDMQVPEGFYEITAFNPASTFHLAMLVSYPNRSDRIRAAGPDPGGDICIHGDCVTIGCVPLTDDWIEELYLICLDVQTKRHTPVLAHFFPTKLTADGVASLRAQYANRPDLIRFWEEIEPGFRLFEETHEPAAFRVDKDGSYVFK